MLVLDPGSWAQKMGRNGSELSAAHRMGKGSCKGGAWFALSSQGCCAHMQLQEAEQDSWKHVPLPGQSQPPALPQPDLQS